MNLSCDVAGRSSPVMLSTAKHLGAHRERSFATLRMTPKGSSQTLRGVDTECNEWAQQDNQGNALLLSEYGSQAQHCHARRGEHLTAPGTRSFAALRMTSEGGSTGDKRGNSG